jgi:hypothetical protein
MLVIPPHENEDAALASGARRLQGLSEVVDVADLLFGWKCPQVSRRS